MDAVNGVADGKDAIDECIGSCANETRTHKSLRREFGEHPAGPRRTFPKIVLGGVLVDVLTRQQWAERIVGYCGSARTNERRPRVIFAANGQVLALHATSKSYRKTFELADGVTADGQPLVWASRLTRSPLPERAATTDLIYDIAREAEIAGLSFFLLGSSEESNASVQSYLTLHYPNLRIVGRHHGYFSSAKELAIVLKINAARPDILWVGLGVKRQEEFVFRNIRNLRGIGCVVTCGGLFDYFTGKIARAPNWMQKCSLEWLFRTLQEPRKYLWRYLTTNIVASFLLIAFTRGWKS